jgi:RNA polymerase sigma-70 factor (ECF subfamily)
MSGETFADLLAPNLMAIRKLILSKTRMPDYADDILQQTLLQAFAHRHQLRSHSKFKSWLSTIAMNEIRQLIRTTRNCLPLDLLPALESPDMSTCPHKTYEKRERARQLYDGLAQLNDRDRHAIHLVDFAQVKMADAANSLSVSLPAFKSTHLRARHRLRRAVRGGPQKSAA